MLQMGNIVRHPQIALPSILASAVLGPLATMVFHMENTPAGAGMGSAGLVGPDRYFGGYGIHLGRSRADSAVAVCAAGGVELCFLLADVSKRLDQRRLYEIGYLTFSFPRSDTLHKRFDGYFRWLSCFRYFRRFVFGS